VAVFGEQKVLLDNKEFRNIIIDSLLDCHKFYRDLEDESSVSLRDIDRFIKVLNWFIENLAKIRSENRVHYKYKPEHFEPCICSFNICYLLRSGSDETRKELKQSILGNIKKLVTEFHLNDFNKIFDSIGDKIYEEICKVGMSIPQHIAFNRP